MRMKLKFMTVSFKFAYRIILLEIIAKLLQLKCFR